MKQSLLLLSLVSCFSASAQLTLTKIKDQIKIEVKNPAKELRIDEPVTVVLPSSKYLSATVMDGNKEIPSQMDDLDGDGVKDELAFVVDLKQKQKKTLKITFSTEQQKPDRYPARVHAQMFFRDKKKKTVTPTDTAASKLGDPKGNMYNKMQHHGPAFESELMAYRIYFDQKQTTDLYGKYNKGLELANSLWYPNDSLLAAGYGDDILLVKGSVGIGTLKGWSGEKAEHIFPVKQRQAVVLAKGPVRTVVDMNVTGWEYKGQVLDVKSRYILFAGQRECQVIQQFKQPEAQNLEFSTGVMKILGSCQQTSDAKGMTASWGTYWPVNDTIKYPMQTLGLAVEIPEQYVVKEVSDSDNYLYIVRPDKNNQIVYRMTVCAEKENFGVKTKDAFFAYVADWKEKKPVIVKEK